MTLVLSHARLAGVGVYTRQNRARLSIQRRRGPRWYVWDPSEAIHDPVNRFGSHMPTKHLSHPPQTPLSDLKGVFTCIGQHQNQAQKAPIFLKIY